ncbi:MAG: hypothetical protein RJQ09_00765 [Cyclobacteriaceae bacterium]
MRNTFMILVLCLSVPAISVLGNGEKAEFQSLTSELEQAVEVRNFKKVKEVVAVMVPLMKEEIKSNKKDLSAYKKGKLEVVSFDAKTVENNLERQQEILDNLEDLSKASPAALRVKSKTVLSLVEEFTSLVVDRA